MDFSVYLIIGYLLAVTAYFYLNFFTLLSVLGFWIALFVTNTVQLSVFNASTINWSSVLSFQFSFNLDGLATIFTFLVSAISTVIFIYAYLYFNDDQRKRRKLIALLQAFGVSMIGAVTSDNMISLFLFWEMTTITSYLLIQFNYTDAESNQLAFNAMLLSVLGGFCLLAAIVFIYINTGTMALSSALPILAKSDTSLEALFILILLSAITKSAQFPFHFWLPGAMKAPTPVSAYLHSATMVNLGLYLLARFHGVFHEHHYWYSALTSIGLITMLLSACVSMMLNDLKKILAYTTIFSLGLMVYLLGSSEWLAIESMLVFLIFHGVYKSGLFMFVGAIDKLYGTRDIKQLTGVARQSWLMALNVIVLFSSMAGLPPFFGFAMKEMLFEAKLSTGSVSVLMMTLGVIASAALAASSIRCMYYLLCKPISKMTPKPKHYLVLMPAIMTTLVLVMWVAESHLSLLIIRAVNTVLGGGFVYEYSISVMSTILSSGTFIVGIIFFSIYLYSRSHITFAKLPKIDGNKILKNIVNFLVTCWKPMTLKLQNLSIDQKYQIIIAFSLLAFLSFKADVLLHLPNFYLFNQIPVVIISAVVIIAATIVVILSHDVMIDIVSLAIFGLFLCAFYLYLGAPDVSMTQFLIEILSVVIIALVFNKDIVSVKCQCAKPTLARILVSIAFGALVFITLIAFWGHTQPQDVVAYYQQNSLKQAFGRNIVNVILVDFRSFDTLGEVLVVLGAMIGVYAYMRRSKHEN